MDELNRLLTDNLVLVVAALAAFIFVLLLFVIVQSVRLGRALRDYRALMGDKELPVPVWIYSRLLRWHHLSFLKTKKNIDLLEGIASQTADAREARQAFAEKRSPKWQDA